MPIIPLADNIVSDRKLDNRFGFLVRNTDWAHRSELALLPSSGADGDDFGAIGLLASRVGDENAALGLRCGLGATHRS